MSTRLSEETGKSLLSLVVKRYLAWAEAEGGFTAETMTTRRACLRQVLAVFGELPIEAIEKSHVLDLKLRMVRRGLSASRQCGILYGLRALLVYARDLEGYNVFPPEEITFP